MQRTKVFGWTTAFFGVVVLAGCSGNSDTTNVADTNVANAANATANQTSGAGSSDVTSVTIGYNPAIVQPQPLIGLEEGAYAKNVASTTFVGKEYKAGPDVIEALRSDAIQIGCSGVFPPMKAFAKDGDIVLLCGGATGGTELSVKGDSPIKTLKDLKGKTIGVNQIGSTVDALVRYNLLKAGLAPDKDVKIVPIDPAQQADALKSGDVQAVAAPAPWPSQAAVKAQARPLIDWKTMLDNGNYLAGSIYTTKKFAAAHPDFIKKFVAANNVITDDLNKDRAKGDARVLAAWNKVSKKTLPPEVAKKAFATIKFTTEAKEADLQRFADLAFQVGLAKKKMDLKGFVVESK